MNKAKKPPNKMSKTKKPLRFRSIFMNYLKGLSALIILFLIIGYLFLMDYQNNLPANVGKQVIKSLETMNLSKLDEMSSNLPASLLNPEDFSKYLADFGTDLDLYYYEGVSKIENQVVFIIDNHDKRMASLTLEKTDKKSMFGFEEYKAIDLVFKPLYEYKIILSAPAELLVNGVSIDQLTFEKTQVQNKAFDQMIFGDLPITTYTFSEFQFINSVSVVNQPEVEIISNPETKTYQVITHVDQAKQDSIATFSEALIKAHTRLISDPSLSRFPFIKTYAYPDSTFSNIVKSYNLSSGYPLVSDSFKDFTVENIIQYGPNVYSVDVRITYTWTATWLTFTKTKVAYPAFTFYITDINDKFQVVDMALLTN